MRGRFNHTLPRTKRLLRALVGRDLLQGPQIACETERHGSDYGGWTVCPQGLGPCSVVYSFGVGQDVSFDLSLIARFGLTVHGFDPTPRSIAWVRAQALPERFRFHPYGLADFDGLAHFDPPDHPAYVSYTLRAIPSEAEGAVAAPVYRLGTIARRLGHDRIDLLKMDIEGAEYAVIADLAEAGVRVHQLLVEFHHRMQGIGVRRTREALARLDGLGYRIFSVAPGGREYSFLRTDAPAPRP